MCLFFLWILPGHLTSTCCDSRIVATASILDMFDKLDRVERIIGMSDKLGRLDDMLDMVVLVVVG